MHNPHAILAYRGGVLGRDKRFPVVAERAEGSYIWDSSGRQLLDFILGFGAVILGHADSRVDDRVIGAIRTGVCRSLNTELEIQLAGELTGIAQVNASGRVVLLRTGSDSTEAAVRLARATTGRNAVVRVGYNGWHDWCAPRKAGIPRNVHRLTTEVAFNDAVALTERIAALGSDLACVVMVPTDTHPPEEGYLDLAKKAAHAVGAVFILDEVRTGFRLALGGAQEFFGVTADLVTYSKALANGYCISAVVGRDEIMRSIDKVSMSSLYFRGADGPAAALATIEILKTTDVIQHIWDMGSLFQSGLREISASMGVPVRHVGLPIMPFHEFNSGDDGQDEIAALLFARLAIERGVMFHPSHHWFICGAMTKPDIELALDAARHAYAGVMRWVYCG